MKKKKQNARTGNDFVAGIMSSLFLLQGSNKKAHSCQWFTASKGEKMSLTKQQRRRR